jgi:small subunit ribosomal protein S8
MAVTDPIGDMLTRIRNALIVGHDSVMIPSSNMKVSLATILKNEGFVEDFEVSEGSTPQGVIKVSLHYGENDEPGINGLKRVSRPGLRVYVRKGEIPRYYGGLGVAILSTSQGVMTGKQAWQDGIGGELLCYVW